jgi:serine/threonine-protein kinase
VAVAPTPVAPPPVQVEEQTPAPVTPAPPAKPVEPTVVRSKPNTQPAKRPLKAPVTARPAPVPAVSKGRLQVKVRPWAQVFVDGEPKGVTPMEAFALPSGQHSVILVNPDLKTQRTYRVSIEEGKQAELKAVLDEPPPP